MNGWYDLLFFGREKDRIRKTERMRDGESGQGEIFRHKREVFGLVQPASTASAERQPRPVVSPKAAKNVTPLRIEVVKTSIDHHNHKIHPLPPTIDIELDIRYCNPFKRTPSPSPGLSSEATTTSFDCPLSYDRLGPPVHSFQVDDTTPKTNQKWGLGF